MEQENIVPASNQQPVTPAKKFNWLVLTVVFIILILLSTAGTYYFLSQRNLKQNSATKTGNENLQPTSTISASVDMIKNWKTRTTRLETLKFPNDWEESRESMQTGGTVFLRPINSKGVSIIINDYVYSNESGTPENLANRALGNEVAFFKKEIEVDGHKTIYQEVHNSGVVRIEVYIGSVEEIATAPSQDGVSKIDTGTQLVTMEIRDLRRVDASKGTFDQILSTFKFQPTAAEPLNITAHDLMDTWLSQFKDPTSTPESRLLDYSFTITSTTPKSSGNGFCFSADYSVKPAGSLNDDSGNDPWLAGNGVPDATTGWINHKYTYVNVDSVIGGYKIARMATSSQCD